MPEVPDRTDWLDPEDEDDLRSTLTAEPTDVEVEVSGVTTSRCRVVLIASGR